jgi:hypothetical protein
MALFGAISYLFIMGDIRKDSITPAGSSVISRVSSSTAV